MKITSLDVFYFHFAQNGNSLQTPSQIKVPFFLEKNKLKAIPNKTDSVTHDGVCLVNH